jgi:KaiC/GvpD/RAD55 family RecA-like ATPase
MENKQEKPVFSLELMQAHLDELTKEPINVKDFFIIKTANECLEIAKSKPIPKSLYFDFWFEFELCILFASSNVGKSILAVQIANLIAKYQRVIYVDCELSVKQFEGRYSENYQNHYCFSDNFFRVELNPNCIENSEEIFYNSVESAIKSTCAKVLIIDNITYLSTSTEKGKEASNLMKSLKLLKEKHGLSILVLAHTPKRDMTKQLSINDLSGSAMIGNFIDSAFTIGASIKDKNLRYLKQIKVRAVEKKYESDNVVVHQIVKYSNFLEFEFVAFANENEHLKEVSEKDKNTVIEQAKELQRIGKTQREIAKELGIGTMTVNRYLKV